MNSMLENIWMELSKERGSPLQEKSLRLDKVADLCKNTFSLFISNLPKEVSRVELEAMFERVGKIIDSFILTDRKQGQRVASDLSGSRQNKRHYALLIWQEDDRGEEEGFLLLLRGRESSGTVSVLHSFLHLLLDQLGGSKAHLLTRS